MDVYLNQTKERDVKSKDQTLRLNLLQRIFRKRPSSVLIRLRNFLNKNWWVVVYNRQAPIQTSRHLFSTGERFFFFSWWLTHFMPLVFFDTARYHWCFQGASKETSGMKWVKDKQIFTLNDINNRWKVSFTCLISNKQWKQFLFFHKTTSRSGTFWSEKRWILWRGIQYETIFFSKKEAFYFQKPEKPV